MKRPTVQDRIEYGLTRALEAGVAVLPRGAASRLGAAIGGLVRFPLGIRRGTVDANLRRAFPDADEAWLDRVRRGAYRHLGREAVEMMRLSRLSRERIIELTETPQWDEFEAARAEGRGVLLVTGHYGNWEVAAAAVAARGVPIEAVVKRQRNRLVDARIESARRRLGIGTIDMRSAPKRIPRALSQGHAIGIVADQDAREAGVWVPFFGVPASTYRGPALFALKFGVPVYAAVARRLDDGRYRIEGTRIPLEATGVLEVDVQRLTGRLARHLEDEIRKDPQQYFWFHKRWKSVPPAELPPRGAGTNT
jgi:KDO2-lipid IV(A) lauroyltransferase